MRRNLFITIVCLSIVTLFAGCSSNYDTSAVLKTGSGFLFRLDHCAEGIVESVDPIPRVDTIVTMVATVRYVENGREKVRAAYVDNTVKKGDKVAMTVILASGPAGGHWDTFATKFTTSSSLGK